MKKMIWVGCATLLLAASGCKDDSADTPDAQANNGASNNGAGNNGAGNNGAGNNGNNGNDGNNGGPDRPDPGPTGNNQQGPECDVGIDCTQPLPLGCGDGEWECVTNKCRAVCDRLPCDYACALDCDCQVDDRGCEIPECVEDCEALADEMRATQDGLRACDAEDDTCAVVENAQCDITATCSNIVSSAADTEPVRLLRIRYAQSRCELSDCACEPPTQSAVCIGGACRLVDDRSCDAPEDCVGLDHDACEGQWACTDAECAWDCAPDCEGIGMDLAAARETLTACGEDDLCVATPNPLCGAVGDCYYFHVADADLTAAQALEGQYSDAACETVDCDCGDAPAVACIDGTCQVSLD